MAKKKSCYKKGNAMTFPLELTEVQTDEINMDNKYLYPNKVSEIQMAIDDICDKMEYDGSLMFDECPDKVSVERIVDNLCSSGNIKCSSNDCGECGNKWFKELVQVMFCNEMSYRKNRRRCHKERLISK